MRRQIIVSGLLIALLLGVGAGVAGLLVATKPAPPRVETVRPALLVETLPVEVQTIIEPIVGYGTARADRAARLSTQVAGEVVEVPEWLKAGAEVQKGQLLARIDDEEYQRLLTRARAALAAADAELQQVDVEGDNADRLIEIAEQELGIAEREYERVTDLFERELAPKREYDLARLALEQVRRALQQQRNVKALLPSRRAAAEANLENRRAEVKIAELNVTRTRIEAPFGGRLAEVFVEEGERLRVGDPVASLVDMDMVEVPVELPASVRPRIRVGAAAELTVDSIEGTVWLGEVKRISPSADAATRTFEVYVEVTNTGRPVVLMPGYFVRATLAGPTLENVIVVPRGVVENGRVFTYEGGLAAAREVRIERHLRDQSVVTGLSPGEHVITTNLDMLYEGAPVRLEEPAIGSERGLAERDGRGTLVHTK